MKLDITEEWFREKSKQEGDLEISAGLGRLPPSYNACTCACHRTPMLHFVACCRPQKPKLTTVWEGDSLDILARESIEGLTKHPPKGKSRYGNQ